MIRRPPRSTRMTHSFPTRRSSDLLDILDIPVAEITRQYVAYIEVMQDLRFELAAEYLVMAAILAEIKSRLLLPRPPGDNEEEEIGRAHVGTPVTNAQLVCRLLIEKNQWAYSRPTSSPKQPNQEHK